MKSKNITLDDLAVMVQQGFAESKEAMDKRFAEVDEEFAKVHEQFTQVHQELRSIRKELEGVVYRPEFEALQDQVRDMQRALSLLKKKPA